MSRAISAAVARLDPTAGKFHVGNGVDGKHYWLTPPDLYARLDAEFRFDFDPCPYPKPPEFDGLSCDWGKRNYVNPPFGSIAKPIMDPKTGLQKINQKGKPSFKKIGVTAWIRKAIAERAKGNLSVLVYPIDKWVLLSVRELLGDLYEIRNLGDVRWLATEDRTAGKGTGRHIVCLVFDPTSRKARPQGAPT